jgi:hypothetical protein
MAAEKKYKCTDCSHVAVPEKKLHGAWIVFLPLGLIGVLFAIALPFVGVPALVIMYIFMRKNHCSSCGSMNVTRYISKNEIHEKHEAEAEEKRRKEEVELEEKRRREQAELERRQLKDESRRISEGTPHFIQSVTVRSVCKPLEVVILGGTGWNEKKNTKFLLSMDASNIYMSDINTLTDVQISVAELREIDISGPGKVSGDAGVIGGGFGMEGAAKGIAIATVINLLTSYSNTKTIIRLTFQRSEIVMLTSQIEPNDARILLSPLFLKISHKQPEIGGVGISAEIQNLSIFQSRYEPEGARVQVTSVCGLIGLKG